VLLHSALPGLWRDTGTATGAVGICFSPSAPKIPTRPLLSALQFCEKPAADDGFSISAEFVRGDTAESAEKTAASRPWRAAGSANPGIRVCQFWMSCFRSNTLLPLKKVQR
jgi:hypothetical protein